jgi:hypothetical protein
MPAPDELEAMKVALWGMHWNADAHVFGAKLLNELHRLGYEVKRSEHAGA